jgi:hypothetical protein
MNVPNIRRNALRLFIIALTLTVILVAPLRSEALIPSGTVITRFHLVSGAVSAGGTAVVVLYIEGLGSEITDSYADCSPAAADSQTYAGGMSLADEGLEQGDWGPLRTYWLDADEPGNYVFTCNVWYEYNYITSYNPFASELRTRSFSVSVNIAVLN